MMSCSRIVARWCAAFLAAAFSFQLSAPAQSLVAWGSDTEGPYTAPVGVTNVVAASMSAWHALALRADGGVTAWGDNTFSQCDVPAGLGGVVKVSAGGSHSLALKSDGTVVAWGSNAWGQSAAPAGLSDVVSVAAGYGHSLALRKDGTVVAWGGETDNGPPAGLGGVVSIAANSSSLAVKSDGTVVAWGSLTGVLNVPAGLNGVVAAALSTHHALALKSNGTVAGWGDNYYGQATVPAGLSNVVAVAAGEGASLALKSDGTVVSWGEAANGAVQVPAGLSGVFAVTAASGKALALVGATAGPPRIVSPLLAVTTGGYGTFYYRIRTQRPATSFTASGLPAGLTLNAGTGVISGTPTQAGEFPIMLGATGPDGASTATLVLYVTGAPVFLGATFPAVWMGGLQVSGQVWASGNGVWSVAGLPPGVTRSTTTGLLSGAPHTPGLYDVTFRFTNSFGITERTIRYEVSPVAAWGLNDAGQVTVPPGLAGTVAVDGGRAHSLALRSDGTVAAWGDNQYGQSTVPANLPAVVAITAGDDHSLALHTNGTVTAWGRNDSGQCAVPASLENVVAIAAGVAHSMALTADGMVVVWGSNAAGQQNQPPGLYGVRSIAAGGTLCSAQKSDGTVAVWGRSGSGNPFILPANFTFMSGLSATSWTMAAIQPDGLGVFRNANGGGTTVNGPWIATAAGDYDSLLLHQDRSVRAVWTTTPTTAPPLNGAAAVAAGGRHYLAVIGPPAGVPHIVSPQRAVAPGGYGGFHYRIMTLSPVTGFSATGLPAGLSLDTASGVISGTASETGTFDVQLTAIAAAGSASAVLRLYVTGAPQFLTSTLDAVWMPGVPPGGAVYASNAAVITAQGMPPGTDVHPALGTVTGTPSVPGLYSVTFRFANAFGFTELTRQIEVSALTAWGRDDDSLNTVPPGLYRNIKTVSAGDRHWLALMTDGRVVSGGRATDLPPVTDAIAVAAGAFHSLVLRENGTVLAAGDNGSGQATVPAGLSDVVAIAAGLSTSVALRKDGTVVSWGVPGNGPAALSGVVAVSAGFYSVMALKSDGTRVTWSGWNGRSAGPGTSLGPAVQIDSGFDHATGLKADGTVIAWSLSGAMAGIPPGLTDAVDTSAGDGSSLALRANGAVVAWGDNLYGQRDVPPALPASAGIGAGQGFALSLTRPGSGPPVIVSPVKAVATGGFGTFYYRIRTLRPAASFAAAGLPAGLTLDAAGVIRGTPAEAGEFNVALEAANAEGTSTATLRLYVTGPPALAVSNIRPLLMAGRAATGSFAATNNARYAAEGLPEGVTLDPVSGQLGGIPGVPGVYPVVIHFSNDFGSGVHAMTIEVTPVAAWGSNAGGQISPPSGLSDTIALCGGWSYSFALSATGTLTGWGGQDATPLPVPEGLTGVTAVRAGRSHALALRRDGTVVAWGSNASGQTSVPAGLGGVAGIAAGEYFSLALKSDGTVAAWGSNSQGAITLPAGLSDITALAAGDSHALALRSDGTVRAWGNNTNGQATVPAGLSNVIAIAAGSTFSVALKADGTVTVWGGGSTFTPPAGLSGVKAVAAAGAHILALRQDGTVAAWGSNTSGQTNQAGITGVVAIGAGSTHSLALVAPAGGPPVITNVTRVIAAAGFGNVHLPVTTLRPAASFIATGLPPGLSLNETTGLISGTPSATGTFAVSLTAVNDAGTSSASLSFTTYANVFYTGTTLPPGWSLGFPPPGAVFNAGGPVAITAEGLPPGTAVHPATGAITGVPQRTGTYAARFRFANAFGSAEQALTFDVAPVAGWGSNADGQISLPAGSASAFAIAGGNDHTLALRRDGTVLAWGSNNYGQAAVPAGLASVIAISGGIEHSLALKSDGTVAAWGRNQYGQTSVPAGLSGVTAIAAGGSHPLVLIGPAITSPANATAFQSAPFTFAANANWTGCTWSAGGLPPGLSIAATTGVITGAPRDQGVHPVTLTISCSGAGRTFTASQNWTLTVAPNTYAAWRAHYLPGGDPPDGDADHDGLVNLLEYALGSSPVDGKDAARPAVARAFSPDRITFTYQKLRTDVTCTVESAAALTGPWSATGVDQGGDGPTVTASLPVNGGRRFLRLRVQ